MYIYIYIYIYIYTRILRMSTSNVSVGGMRHDLLKHAERDHGGAGRLDPLRQCPPRVHNVRGFRTKCFGRGLGVNGRLRQRVRWEGCGRWQIDLEIAHRVFDFIHPCVFITPAKFGRNLIDCDLAARERAVYLHTHTDKYVTCEKDMANMNQSWRIWMSHDMYEYRVHLTESGEGD